MFIPLTLFIDQIRIKWKKKTVLCVAKLVCRSSIEFALKKTLSTLIACIKIHSRNFYAATMLQLFGFKLFLLLHFSISFSFVAQRWFKVRRSTVFNTTRWVRQQINPYNILHIFFCVYLTVVGIKYFPLAQSESMNAHCIRFIFFVFLHISCAQIIIVVN